MGNAGNAGIRFLIALGVISLALFLEYALSSGGVLRWLLGSAPMQEPAATPAAATPAATPPAEPARRDVAPSRPAPPARAPQANERRFGALPLEASFEGGDAGWTFDARGGDGLGARSMDTAYNGHFALYAQASEAANRGWPGWFDGARYKVAQGRRYVFRARATSPDGGNAWLDIQLYDRAGTWLGGRSTGCSRERPGRDWQLLELRYTVDDPRVDSVGLALLQCLNHTRGRMTSVYFDDVTFAGAPP